MLQVSRLSIIYNRLQFLMFMHAMTYLSSCQMGTIYWYRLKMQNHKIWGH